MFKLKIKKMYYIISLVLLVISIIFFLSLFDIVFLDVQGYGLEGATVLSSTILLVSSAFIFLKGYEKDR